METYRWYNLINNNSEISQGDIFIDYKIPTVIKTGDEAFDVRVLQTNCIVLTQACDLANNKIDMVTLCSLIPIEIYVKSLYDSSPASSQDKKIKQIEKCIKDIRQGFIHKFLLLNNYNDNSYSMGYQIADFSHLYSVSLEELKRYAQQINNRIRLCPPYRDYLSQGFARYFMRVGLPVNLEVFDKQQIKDIITSGEGILC